jgi:exosortase A-associated hydrolase 2
MPATSNSGHLLPGPNPLFLDSEQGPLYAVYHRPQEGVPITSNVICIPGFNEEMNRCRSMVTLQAQAFAAAGIGTLAIDLYGTGDSGGEYRDARWDAWRENVRTGIRWLDGQPGGCAVLWGIRLGAILATEVARSLAERRLSLLLWQPIVDGKQYFTQFLRLRLAAQMDRPDIPKETTASMRAQFAEGQTVEIGGYEIHPTFANALDQLRLVDFPPSEHNPTLWLEHATGEQREPSPASQRVVEAWVSGRLPVTVRLFDGQAFWQLHERAVAPEAIARTMDWIAERGRQA